MIYRFSELPIRIQAGIFVETGKPILKFVENCKGPRIAKAILKKKKENSHQSVHQKLTQH